MSQRDHEGVCCGHRARDHAISYPRVCYAPGEDGTRCGCLGFVPKPRTAEPADPKPQSTLYPAGYPAHN